MKSWSRSDIRMRARSKLEKEWRKWEECPHENYSPHRSLVIYDCSIWISDHDVSHSFFHKPNAHTLARFRFRFIRRIPCYECRFRPGGYISNCVGKWLLALFNIVGQGEITCNQVSSSVRCYRPEHTSICWSIVAVFFYVFILYWDHY